MKDNQKKYLDKVVDLIVSDTIIDYDNDRIRSPFSLTTHQPTISLISHHLLLLPFLFPPFFKYCKDTYGLTKPEIDYVWDQYRDIIKDKLTTK
tara:strand:+ start:117 stop:395 length:279 start_codon:yes stop_codon:yes gene_type:complete